MNLTSYQKEFITDAAYGYLNGFYDMGASAYPPITMNDLVTYVWETIEYERDMESSARALYFKGKKAMFKMIEILIRKDDEFKAVVIDF